MTLTDSASHAFLTGEGQMAAFILSHNWSSSTLGDLADWPSNLRTTIGILLNTPLPAILFWGTNSNCFFNDRLVSAYGLSNAANLIGTPASEIWQEDWPHLQSKIFTIQESGQASKEVQISFSVNNQIMEEGFIIPFALLIISMS